MTPEERSRKNAVAFLDAIVTPGGFKIRPLGYLTISNIQLLGLKLEGEQVLKDHVDAFLFIQAAPLPVVTRAIREHEKRRVDPAFTEETAFDEFMIRAVMPWLAEIPPDGILAAYEQLATLDEVDAAMVHAEPPPGVTPEAPDPN